MISWGVDIETGTITSKDGTELYIATGRVEGSQATLVFVHGYAEHCRRYDHVFQWFGEQGFDVAALDLRGHGRSAGRRGHVQRFGEYREDLDALVGHVLKSGDADRKLYLCGHSNGGLVVANYVLTQPEGIDGIVLSSPLMGFKLAIPAWKEVLAKGASLLVPTLALPSGIPPEHISHDPAAVAAYSSDPLVFQTATARYYTESVAAQRETHRGAGKLLLPVLLLLAAVGSTDKELRWYDGLYHEIFNELERETVFRDMLAWLQSHI